MTLSLPDRTSDLTALRSACPVHLPGDPGYDAARQPWNLAVDLRPAAVAVPRSVEEVVAAVRAAVAAGLRIAPQSTGHGAGPLAEQPLDDVLLLKLHELTGVTIDPVGRTARVLGGTLWRDVVTAAAPHGLAALHGSAGDVAVAGYVTGGGLSFYGRAHGLAASSVTAVEVVTADGEIVRASADQNDDLFWAVRGGGGSFGVLVAIELDLLPIPDVYAGMLLWDLDRAPQVLRVWAAWTEEVPDSVTTSIRMVRFPPLPQLPPFLRGRSLVLVDGAILEDDERAAEILAPLRELAPEMDTFGRIPLEGMLAVHLDPPGPTPGVSDTAALGELTEGTLRTLLDVAGPDVETPLFFAEIRHLGGRLGVPDPRGGAVDHMAAPYVLFCLSAAPTPAMAEAGRAAVRGVVEAVAPWTVPQLYANFADRRFDVSTVHALEVWERLRGLREVLDPDGVWLANHPVA